MSRFVLCRDTTLEKVVKKCGGNCRGIGGFCPCTEDLIYSANILKDPGFNNGGGGPGGNEIPETNGALSGSGANGKMVWSDGSIAPLTSPWCAESVSGRTKNWNYVGGTATYVKATSGGENLQLPERLMPVGFTHCEDVPPGYLNTPLSGRVDPSDFVQFTVTIGFSGTVTSPTCRITITFLDVDFLFGSNHDSSFFAIPATISYSAVAPADAFYVRTLIVPSYGGIGTSTATITADNAILEVV